MLRCTSSSSSSSYCIFIADQNHLQHVALRQPAHAPKRFRRDHDHRHHAPHARATDAPHARATDAPECCHRGDTLVCKHNVSPFLSSMPSIMPCNGSTTVDPVLTSLAPTRSYKTQTLPLSVATDTTTSGTSASSTHAERTLGTSVLKSSAQKPTTEVTSQMTSRHGGEDGDEIKDILSSLMGSSDMVG